MYGLHLVTCSFKRIKCVPKEGHHKGQDLVVERPRDRIGHQWVGFGYNAGVQQISWLVKVYQV